MSHTTAWSGSNTVFANCASLAGHVEIGDWVILGGLSAVHQHCKIGAHAFLGGGAIVTRDVPPYVMVAGNPGAPHTVNSEGLKRRGFTDEQIRNLREAYRILYRSELKLAEALERLEPCRQRSSPSSALFVDFIRSLHTQHRTMMRGAPPASPGAAVGSWRENHSGDQPRRGADRGAARARAGSASASASRDRR